MNKICVVTGNRAEYGLLKPLIEKISQDSELELILYVTGAHLSTEYGLTYKEIEKDSFPVARKIEMLLSADTASGIIKSMGIEMIGLADILSEDKPNIMIILGDRYEMLVAATAAMMHCIPIAHIHGGELTEGAIDDAIRHAITKMSHLHFAATEEYRQRIIQMGECPDRVFNVGALGVENIRKVHLLSRTQLEESLHISLSQQTAIVTFHPVTLEKDSVDRQFANLLEALDQFPQMFLIFTKANSDEAGHGINYMMEQYVKKNQERCKVFDSLGQFRYLSLLKYCSIVIGNSSSGIIEAPSFGVSSIDIGSRQHGRVCAKSVIHCEAETADIELAIEKGLQSKYKEQNIVNPYEKENTSEQIVARIRDFLQADIGVKKQFFDMTGSEP